MVNIRENIEKREKEILSPFAAKSSESQGRLAKDTVDPFRTCYAIDRDRIIHSFSFRKEKDKTQVFILPTDDHCMNRLTHTLEVSQIAKTIATALNLNETLAEAIALGHDTAHTCFGHAGERTLNKLCSSGYIHAEETFRRLNVIDKLNLTKEVLDGMKNHSGLTNSPNAMTLEGQIAPFADKIAYLTSDFENAIDMGIISDLPERVKKNLGATKGKIIDTLVTSIITTSYNKPQIKMDDAVYDEMVYFREFAFNEIYLSKKLMAENEKAEHIIEHLFEYYMKHPWEIKDVSDSSNLERSVTDYIAGMTDTFALNEYEKYFSIQRKLF